MTTFDAWGNEYVPADDEPLPRNGRTWTPLGYQRTERLKDRRTKVQHMEPAMLAAVLPDDSPPETPIQALMEAAAHQEPEESIEEREERLEPIRQAIEHCGLSERERYVVDALFWRRIGLRAIGAEFSTPDKPQGLSHAQIARNRDEALRKIREYMEDHS